jgi:hypothetical protein
MLRRFIPGLLLLLPSALWAQEGSIAFTHSVRLEIPEETRARFEGRRGNRGGDRGALPTERVTEVVLFFNATESLMKPVPRGASEGGRGRGGFGGPGGGADGRNFTRRVRSGLASRDAQETLVEAHTRYDEGTIVEARDLLGRSFIIAGQRPSYEWKLSSEQAEFLGYVVQKATAVQDSSAIEAWFTTQIPVQGGPATFGGLPGMILVVSINDGQTQYTATGVSMSPIAEGVIAMPTGGDEVTREEYEQILAEKLDELRATQRRGRG